MITVLMNSNRARAETVDLQRLLREKFPGAHGVCRKTDTDTSASFGLPCLDAIAIPKGGITEIVSSGPSSGSALLSHALLRRAGENRQFFAFIDGTDAFDPQSAGPGPCRQLLWVRCRHAADAVKTADLLLRDGNLPFVIMDLQLNPRRELRRIPDSSWFRLKALTERTGATFLALTPEKRVPSADLRLQLESRFTLDAFDLPREALHARLTLRITRDRGMRTGIEPLTKTQIQRVG